MTILSGATSGFLATAPMTAFMFAAHSQLPHREQYPLPPREIVDALAEKAEIRAAPENVMRAATWISHFGYGAAMGSIFTEIKTSLPGNAATKGAVFGVAVWAASYIEMLPALNILKPVKEHPIRRTGLMIAAHVIWGVALGITDEYLEKKFTSRD